MSQGFIQKVWTRTFKNAATCTQHGPVKLVSGGVQDCGAGEASVGIWESLTTSVVGRAGEVTVLGITKVMAAGVISARALIQPAGSGKVTTATDLDTTWSGAAINPCGQLLDTEGGADGDLIEAMVAPSPFLRVGS